MGVAWWEPRASGAGHRLLGRYRDERGNQVDVFFALYAGQGEGREAGGFGEGALMPGTEWNWASPGPDMPPAKSERLRWGRSVERIALTYYRTGDLLSGSNARLKLANIADRVQLRARPTAMLILSAEQQPGYPAPQALQSFITAAGNPGAWMDRIAAAR